MTTKFRVSPVMTTSIPLHRYDATACIISMQRPVRSSSRAQLLNPLRISHPKIDKLACQAQGADIFTLSEIPLRDATIYIFKLWNFDRNYLSSLKKSSRQLPKKWEFARDWCLSALKKHKKNNGAPSGTRTLDPLIKSQLLYQLS